MNNASGQRKELATQNGSTLDYNKARQAGHHPRKFLKCGWLAMAELALQTLQNSAAVSARNSGRVAWGPPLTTAAMIAGRARPARSARLSNPDPGCA